MQKGKKAVERLIPLSLSLSSVRTWRQMLDLSLSPLLSEGFWRRAREYDCVRGERKEGREAYEMFAGDLHLT